MKTICFFLCLFISGNFFSQKIDINWFLNKYPNEPFVYLEKLENTELKLVKNNFSVIKSNHEKILVLKNSFNNIRNKKIRTNDFVKVSNINAQLFVYNGSKHSKKTISSIELKKEHNDDGTFYDNDKFYNISFLDAKEGDIVEISYDEEYLEPRFFGAFYFSDYYPTIRSAYTISYPPDVVKLFTKEFNNQSIAIKETELQVKKNKIISWTMDTIPALKEQDYEPGFRHRASYVLVSIESYKTADSTVNLCGNLNNLYSWYMELFKNLDLSQDKAMTRLTDSLVKDVKDDKEKVKKIFDWVKNKIAYLAYEDGLGGYIPREASVVCGRRFGDCKDMANLIVKMSQSQKLPVYHAWIGTREIPYQFTDFPAPFCANHMIAVYITNKDTIFLDATGKNYPFGLPTAMTQGKEALVGLSKEKFCIAKVPVIDKIYNADKDSIILNIGQNNKIEGTGYYSISGYEQISLLNVLEKKSYLVQKNYLRGLLEKGNNKFKLDTFYLMEQNIEKYSTLFYKFSINDYLTENNNSKFINLNFLKTYFDKFNTTNRKYAFDFSYACTTTLLVTLKLDPGQKVESIAANESAANNVVGFKQKYSKTENAIYFENTIFINKPAITPADFGDWNSVINVYKKTRSNLVSVTSK